MIIQFFIFVFCLLATYALYLLLTYKTEAHRAELNQRLREVLLHSAHSQDEDVRVIRQELMSEIPWLDTLLLRVPLATRLRKVIDQADSRITVAKLFLVSALAGLMGALAVATVVSSSLLIFIAAVVTFAVPFLHIFWKRKRRLHRFLELLPDALDLMARSLSAGHAFQESLHMVATEMPEPIAMEFQKTYEEQNLGLSLKLALDNLADRIPLIDLQMCITGVMIQRETGGDLADILGKVAHTIRERFRILEDLKTLTTSSRASAWILCALPLFIAVVITFIDPDYMSVLWFDPRGHTILIIAAIMQVSGILLVRRILNIKI